jgi:tetratricopeptide (TPR) repeat protein
MVFTLSARLKHTRAASLYLAVLSLLAPSLAPMPLHAQSADAQRYVRCVNLVNTMPQKGFEEASAWRAEGGASSAKHCLALALIALNKPRQAAEVLDSLASDFLNAQRNIAASDILSQSGNAWLLAGDNVKAEERLSRALAFSGAEARELRSDLLLDRARARFEQQNLEGTLDDLTQAHQLAPKRADILLLRATAYRVGGLLVQAQADIQVALMLEPAFPPIQAEAERISRLLADEKISNGRVQPQENQ